MRVVLVLMALALGCGGTTRAPQPVDDAAPDKPVADGTTDGTAETGDPPSEQVSGACKAARVGPRLLRRLTRDELRASVRAAFPVATATWDGGTLSPDIVSEHGFTNDADVLVVGAQAAAELLAVAEEVAALIAEPTALAAILPCAAFAADKGCAETLLLARGRRLFRRPLTAEEAGPYLDLYALAAEQGGFHTGVRWMLVALLQSPHFLYRPELGAEDGQGYALTDYELATQLAFAFTGAPPSDALLDLAEEGGLSDPQARVTLARELLESPEGRAKAQDFVRAWTHYGQVGAETKPGIADFDMLRAALIEETERFVEEALYTDEGDLAHLLTAPYTVVDGSLAAYYGMTPGGAGFTRIARPEGHGVGLLAQGSILSAEAQSNSSSPTQRGLLVYERLLCRPKLPPPDVVPNIPAPEPGEMTTRDRYELVHAASPACNVCHQFFDPIGFGFEHFDEGGRYRADESVLPINATGEIVSLNLETLFSFDGQAELASVLATNPVVTTCVGDLMSAYTFGGAGGDVSCIASDADTLALHNGEIGLLDYFARLAAAPHFSRRVQPDELDPQPEEPDDPVVGVDPPPEPQDPEPEPDPKPAACGQVCSVVPGAAASDEWCQLNCNHDPPFCPPEHCSCEDVPCE